jgi:hypothetical protein
MQSTSRLVENVRCRPLASVGFLWPHKSQNPDRYYFTTRRTTTALPQPPHSLETTARSNKSKQNGSQNKIQQQL